MNVIGLGSAGCQLADCLKKYQQYNIFSVDTENKEYSKYRSVIPQSSHEEYEKNYKKINLRGCSGETLLVLSGASQISGIALRLLEQLKNRKVNVMYIKSDEAVLSKQAQMSDRITFFILQEYARSNKINNMFIVSNKNIESILEGNISLQSYWQQINEVIASTFHMYNVFQNTEPLLTSRIDIPATAKMISLGVVNFKTGKERPFYDLQYPRVKNYFYGVNSETLENDKDLLHNIRQSTLSEDDNLDVGFSIFSTDYEQNYVYSAHFASYIQEQNP